PRDPLPPGRRRTPRPRLAHHPRPHPPPLSRGGPNPGVPLTDQPVSPAPPTGRAAHWRAAADAVEAMNEGCGQRKPCASCDAREYAADALRDTARRLAAEPEPGVRHVHITIRHPDPTTAHTAALCIADLIHAEYGDSLNLAITTDAPDAGAAPPRPAGEAPDTTA